jgi:hypothetical protein
VFQLRDRGFTFSPRSYSRPERVGIAPIEDILGREVVSSNRRASNRSWQVRSNVRLCGGERRHREVEASVANRAGDRGCQNLRWKGRLSQLKGAGSLRRAKVKPQPTTRRGSFRGEKPRHCGDVSAARTAGVRPTPTASEEATRASRPRASAPRGGRCASAEDADQVETPVPHAH